MADSRAKPDATTESKVFQSATEAAASSSQVATTTRKFPIVGIGASAGGLEAIEAFFDHMPPDSGMAFVVVQHLSPNFKSLMDELLARHTEMSICRVENGMEVQPNGIYLIPPKKNMVISAGNLLLTEQDASGGLNLPIDILFRSMARDVGSRSIAVVLSGTGSDGSRGLREVHEVGGLVVVQEVDSAGFDGMPRNALATGVADIVACPEDMPERILDYVRAPASFPRAPSEEPPATQESDMAKVFRLFRNKFGIDFRYYRPTTINRRLERRVTMSQLSRLSDYVDQLESDPDELDALYRDLLVEVTHFFRDEAAFDRLRANVIPEIVASASLEEQVRVWAPGCATGEEAYSLAMLFHDCADTQKRDLNIKIFATDVHNRSLETASMGVYSSEVVARMPAQFRDRYLVQHGNLYHVSSDLRKMVIFAPHDITKDPPFTKLDMLVCRNVLIYLEAEVQQKILAMFHFGLKTGGTLWLGPSETVRPFEREFEIIDSSWKVFRKLRDVRLREAAGMSMRPPLNSAVRAKVSPLAQVGRRDDAWSTTKVFEELLSRHVPPSLLVNEHFELVHSFGAAQEYLTLPGGKSTLEVLKMVQGDLRTALSAALHRCNRQQGPVVYKGVRVEIEGQPRDIRLVVEPHRCDNETLFLISFEPLEEAPPPRDLEADEDFDLQGETAERLTDLEQELRFTKETLQTTVEELETSNEELQATNEELVASNEELQSTNEELHSVNEELYTVNAEHQRKISELTELTADMENLLRGTQIGTIFLDRELRIRKFTPSIAAAFNVMEQDIGRPIEHIAYNLDNPELMEDIAQVIRDGQLVERKVRDRDGRPYFQRITPYRQPDREIGGAIITFNDVTAIEQANEEIERRSNELERTNLELVEFAYAVSHDLQAPLRHIVDHGKILQQEASGALTDEAARSLRIVTDSAERMQTMIRCLLAYSRVHTRGEEAVDVDCGVLLAEVQEELAAAIAHEEAEITHDPLPTIRADRGQLKTVFYHLIDNAIRYRRDAAPRIHVDARFIGGEWEFSIEDNGMGIEPRSFERIFVIFQRLYRDEEIPGDGLGLALCKRIVERHGGRIWLASRPGRGSTFYFTIAAEPHRASVKSSGHRSQGSAQSLPPPARGGPVGAS